MVVLAVVYMFNFIDRQILAILLPATFSMDPIVGLTLLLGIYGSSMFGGAIPAILINTPGTSAAAAK